MFNCSNIHKRFPLSRSSSYHLRSSFADLAATWSLPTPTSAVPSSSTMTTLGPCCCRRAFLRHRLFRQHFFHPLSQLIHSCALSLTGTTTFLPNKIRHLYSSSFRHRNEGFAIQKVFRFESLHPLSKLLHESLSNKHNISGLRLCLTRHEQLAPLVR